MSWFLTLSLVGALAGSPADGPASKSKTPVTTAAPSPADMAATLLAADNRRIRAATPLVGALINEGIRRSRTFASLVNDIHRTNVIIYVESSMGLPVEVAGRILFAGAAGDQRYLRVQVRATLARDQMIAVIAHELRHALEVADERSVVNERALEDFYRRVGDSPHAGGGYDTEAARVVQRIVRSELIG
jgi:hypothetical protein